MIPKLAIDVEYLDGTTDQERIYAADKIRAETHARRQGWEFEEGPRIHTAIGHAALTRAGKTSLDLPDWLAIVADFRLINLNEQDADDPH